MQLLSNSAKRSFTQIHPVVTYCKIKLQHHNNIYTDTSQSRVQCCFSLTDTLLSFHSLPLILRTSHPVSISITFSSQGHEINGMIQHVTFWRSARLLSSETIYLGPLSALCETSRSFTCLSAFGIVTVFFF